MQNIIAVIWDFDKTLIDGNMQDPIFEEYHIDKAKFWQHVNELPARYAKDGVKVNADTIYLNQFIKDAHKGIFKGLNNEKLKTFGQKQKYYHGVPEIFKNLQRVVEDNPKYREYNIRVEHYIVSTGMSAIIKGSAVMPYVEAIWGCDSLKGLMEKSIRLSAKWATPSTIRLRRGRCLKSIRACPSIRKSTSMPGCPMLCGASLFPI